MPRRGNGTSSEGIVGRQISIVREMTPHLLERERWFKAAPIVVLDDATILYPSKDLEGNDGGALFGEAPLRLVPPGEKPGFFVFGGPESEFLMGRVISSVQPMTTAEMEHEGWTAPAWAVPPVIVLDNGIKLFPSMDAEGNGPGAFVGRLPDGQPFTLAPDGKIISR